MRDGCALARYMDCIVLYCICSICCICCIDGLRCIVVYSIVLYCIVLYVLHCCISIEGWSRIWPSNEFIPHHTSAPPDHRPRVYKTKMQRITILDGTDHIAYCAISRELLRYVCFSFYSWFSSQRKRSIPMSFPPQQGQAQGG